MAKGQPGFSTTDDPSINSVVQLHSGTQRTLLNT